MATTTPKIATKRRLSQRPKAPNAIELLKQDHDEVKKMYRRYQKLVDQGADPEARQTLAMQICRTLTIHATAEEEIFYSALRRGLKDKEPVNHADVEHACAKDLIAQIESMGPTDLLYDAKVCVLCEYVAHHVKEEEGEMFAKSERAKLNLANLGKSLAMRKLELAEGDDPVG